MKKVFRAAFSFLVLSSLAVSQLPTSAHCQMTYGSFLAKSCSMPCCKTTMPMSRCPFLKAAQPRDVITASSAVLKISLEPMHHVGLIVLPALRRIAFLTANAAETLQLLFAGPSQSVRAPPTNIHLLNA